MKRWIGPYEDEDEDEDGNTYDGKWHSDYEPTRIDRMIGCLLLFAFFTLIYYLMRWYG